jgi:hypothetical protein
MADQFDTFQKEIEEDLQRERLQKLWEQYGTYLIAGAVAIVLAVAAWKFTEARRQAAAQANAARYLEAVKSIAAKTPDVGQKALADLANNPAGYGLLARLRLAGADATAGQTDKAVAAYDVIAKQPGIDKIIADYARLQTAMLTVDTATWTDTQNRLIELAAEGNPWRHGARELLGIAAAKAGNAAEARTQFERLLADPATPKNMSDRANIVMGDLAQAELAKVQSITTTVPTPVTPEVVPAPASPPPKRK